MSTKKSLKRLEQEELERVCKDVDEIIEVSLDSLSTLRKGRAQKIPAQLEEMGILNDESFRTFLITFYNVGSCKGLEAAEKKHKPKRRYHELSDEDYADIIGLALTTWFISWKFGEAERVRLRDLITLEWPVIEFLTEFLDTAVFHEHTGGIIPKFD